MVCATFPASPTLGQQFTVGNATYEWDGQKWNSVAGPLTLQQISGLTKPSDLDLVYVREFGSVGSMSAFPGLVEGQSLSTGATNWSAVASATKIALQGGLYAKHLHKVYAADFGFVDDYDPDTKTGTDNTQAIQDAINALPNAVIRYAPTRYTGGGGVVVLPGAYCKITAPIELTYGTGLEGMGRGVTHLIQTTVGEDAINIVRNVAAAQYYAINDVTMSDMTIVGAVAGVDAGIAARDDTNCWAITNCAFRDLDIIGFNVGMHFFGGWNNLFENVEVSGRERYVDGVIGIIAETCTGGNSYGPTGKTRIFTDAAGGFNCNTFINCTFINLNRIGVLISAKSSSHAYANVFQGCNIEAIHFNTESPLTYSPYTDAISYGVAPVVNLWDGRPVGFMGIGRVIGTTYDSGGYVEEFYSLTGGVSNADGVGFLWDDFGIEFSPNVSKNYNNKVTGAFFNSDVSRPVHYGRCNYCGTEQNTYLITATKGMYRELKNSGIYSINEYVETDDTSPAQVPFDYINTANERVKSVSTVVRGEGLNYAGDGFQALDTNNYRIQDRWTVGGGKRKFRKEVSVNGASVKESEYTEVSSTGTGRHGLKGFPINGGKVTIPSGTSGSFTVVQGVTSDNDAPTFVTILTAGSGITSIDKIERTTGSGFVIFFSGSTVVDTQISYMLFGL